MAILRFNKFVNLINKYQLMKNYSSALYIPGNKATDTFSYLTPYLDYEKQFSNIENLKKNIKTRKLNDNIDDLAKSWEFYKNIDNNRKSIEEKREIIGQQMKNIMKNKSIDGNDKKIIEGLRLQGKTLKQDLKSIKEIIWDLEETIVPRLLNLPNEIDEKTPETLEVVLKSSGKVTNVNKSNKSHLEIGKKLGLIKYINPLHIYLCNDAAHFELATIKWTSKVLSDSNMLRITGTDFAKSLVVEAACLDYENPYDAFHLKNNENNKNKILNQQLHLIGGASLISFLSMHTKQLINPKDFPLKYFSTGRQYIPIAENSSCIGLFGSCQTSAIQSFAMVQKKTSPQHQDEFENMINNVTNIYEQLEIPYRIVLRSADQLKNWESLRVSFEIWSNYYNNYIETGHLSVCGDFFSKRLLIAYQTPTGRDYPAIITGTVLSVNRLLACLIEQSEDQLFIPKCIKQHMSV